MPSGKASRRKRKFGLQEDFYLNHIGAEESFRKGGLTIKQKGTNVLISNNRTPAQHAAHLEAIKLGRPKILSDIKSQVAEVIGIFEQYDNLKLLGGLAYKHLKNQTDPKDDGLSELNCEYALSFATALDGNPVKQPAPQIINRLADSLIAIRHKYNAYMMTEHVNGQTSELESQLRYKTILQALYLRGDAYPQHFYSIYKELFSGHDEFLSEKYGFTSSDILDAILQLEDSFCCRLASPSGQPHPGGYKRFQDWSTKYDPNKRSHSQSMHFMDHFAEDNLDLVIEGQKLVAYNISDVATYPKLFKIRFRSSVHEKVVSAICLDFGSNKGFLNPKFIGLPLNDSKIFTNPVIKFGVNYYLFSFTLVTRYLFNIAESLLLKADKKYYNQKFLGNKYARSRDNYLEIKTAELFKVIIPNSASYLNLTYKNGDVDEHGNLVSTELDLLIISYQANYLVEIKAGELSAASKRGALMSLSDTLEDVVGYGAYQSSRALKYIQTDDGHEFFDDNGDVVTVGKHKRTFRITVTLEHLASLSTYMHDLKELGIIGKDIEFAWTCSIFDLIVFSKIIENENDFIEYLEKRIPLYQRREMDLHDEIDILGYFLERGLKFDEELIKDLSRFQLNNFSKSIDAHFMKGEKKPVRV